MALRQREWVIYIRPYYTKSSGGSTFRIDYANTPRAGRTGDLGYTTGQNTASSLKGVGEGGGDCDTGGWVMWYKTSSFKKLREKYKEILQLTSAQNIRIAEIINVDTMITPIS